MIYPNQQYDNSKLFIPTYSEQDIKMGKAIAFPFNCVFMTYDKYIHEYTLTTKALEYFGIPVKNDAKADLAFRREVSRAVYSGIKVGSGKRNYPAMMYRVAKGLGAPFMSPLAARTNFLEECLIVQAKHMISGNAKDVPKVVQTEGGRVKTNDMTKIDLYWLHDDVIITLQSLNLINSQRVRYADGVNWNEF